MYESGKVAIVHDWLTGMRGGEVVLEAILDLFPGADLYTLIHNRGSVSRKIEDRKIFTSFVDRFPLKRTKYRQYLPFFPTAIEMFDFHEYDLVVSSSHCVAKGALVPPGIPHVSFLHSPMRYVWDMYHDYFPPRGFANRFIVPPIASYLRTWDAASAPRVDRYISNSRFVAERIRRYYGREATVIHPPCVSDDVKVPLSSKREEFYLIVSALVPYKRIDLAVDAFRNLDRRLVIVGKGPEADRLKKSAPANVEFLGALSDEEVKDLYGRARALLFPGLEDFGIVPVESQAMGCPVIAYGAGGAVETVLHKKTGYLFDKQTPESMRQAIIESETLQFQVRDFQKNVLRFTKGQFQDGLLREIRIASGRPVGSQKPSR